MGFADKQNASWGAQAVFEAGQYHLIFADFQNCGLGCWGDQSQISRAVSQSPAAGSSGGPLSGSFSEAAFQRRASSGESSKSLQRRRTVRATRVPVKLHPMHRIAL